MFSSIRNRHSSEYLNDLVFYSPGTNLLTRYENNTLLMDSILGLKYIIDKNDPMKYGFTKIDSSGEYNLYENKDALPLGILTDDQIFEIGAVETQIDLFNHFSKMNESLFTINPIKVVDSKNVKMTKSGNDVTYQALDLSKPIEIEWYVEVPAHTQSYVSMFPVQYEKTCDAMVALKLEKILM